MRRLHRIGVWIFVLVLGVALGKVGPYLFLSFTGDCSFRNTIRSIRHHATLRSRIAELSRLIAHNKKICDGFALYSTPAGHFWVPREDELSLPLELAEQELGIYQTNDVSVQPGDVVLDCGAHFGAYTRKALALAHVCGFSRRKRAKNRKNPHKH